MDMDLKQFGQLIARAQFELYAFICILMEGEADAADVLQDTNLALWTHAERYDPSQPFLPWARSFAYNQVRAFRLKQNRSRLVFDDALLDWFAEHAVPETKGSGPGLEVLSRLEVCLSKLTEAQRTLLRMRYTEEKSLKEIASRLLYPVSAVGVMLHRTRGVLAACMKRSVTAGGAG